MRGEFSKIYSQRLRLVEQFQCRPPAALSSYYPPPPHVPSTDKQPRKASACSLLLQTITRFTHSFRCQAKLHSQSKQKQIGTTELLETTGLLSVKKGVILGVYRVYLKYLDKLQEWVPHTRTKRKNLHTNTCPRTVFEVRPTRSPDLTPWDVTCKHTYKFWCIQHQLKMRHFTNAFLYLSTNLQPPGTFEGVRQSMMRSVHACKDSDGGHFEQLWWNVTW
jgi:hypothetical protein